MLIFGWLEKFMLEQLNLEEHSESLKLETELCFSSCRFKECEFIEERFW